MRTPFILGSTLLCLAPQALGQIAFGPELLLFSFEEYNMEVASGDVDGDGRPDLFMRTGPSPYGPVSWYPNLGGTFGEGAELYSGQWVSLPGMLDVDIDGYRDLVYQCPAGTCWQEGLGVSSFGPAEQLSTHFGAPARLVDVDGDGIQDIYLGTGWLKSDGSGGYEPRVMPFGDHVNLIDVNEDGLNDVIFSSGSGPYYIESRLNDGSGGFGGSNFIAGEDPLQGIFVTDVTNDGDEDVVIWSDTVLKLMENQGNGTFAPQSMAQTLFAGSIKRVVSVDLDADGDVDFLKMGLNDLTLLVNNGSGNLTPQLIHTFGAQGICDCKTIGCADLDGDGRLDVLAGYSHAPGPYYTVSWFPVLAGLQEATLPVCTISPNPMTGSTELNFGRPLSRACRIELVDVTGRAVRTWPVNGTQGLRIERGDLRAGLYGVRACGTDAPQGMVRLVVE